MTGDVPRATVVVVEDHESVRSLMRSVLALLPGVEVVVESDGRRGYELVRARKPSVAIVDLRLPSMDGESVVRALRADPETSGIPVVVVSGDLGRAARERLHAAGASECLEKPVGVDALLDAVRRYVGEAR